MRHLKFYGSSDDLFEIEGSRGEEPDEISPGTVTVSTPDGQGLCVTCLYATEFPHPDGCWMIGISPLEQDKNFPGWGMNWSLAEEGYSTLLTLHCPDSAVIRKIEE